MEIEAEVRFVKSRYRDTRTCDFAQKYLISSGIAEQKISESFMYVALTVQDLWAFMLGGFSEPPP